MSEHFCVVRCDGLGDTLLALPVAALLKAHYPGCRVTLIARRANAALARHSEHVDGTLDLEWLREASSEAGCARRLATRRIDTLIHLQSPAWLMRAASRAGIRRTVGNWRRGEQWRHCNRRAWVARRGTSWHEAQLNLRLLTALGLPAKRTLWEIGRLYGLVPAALPATPLTARLDDRRYRLVVHPKSNGTSCEWPSERFAAVIRGLDPRRFQVVVTGSAAEREAVAAELPLTAPHVVDLMGRTDTVTLASVVAACDALLAVSTGPLHLAAALGRTAVGIYPPIRTTRSRRWGPVGPDVRVFEPAGPCNTCPGAMTCPCVREIMPSTVIGYLAQRARGAPAAAPLALTG